MNVRVRRSGQVEVNNVINLGDIQTSRSDVGCNQDTFGVGFESVEVLKTLLLLEMGVKRENGKLEESEKGEKTTDRVDRVNKDDRSARVSEKEIIEIEILHEVLN